MANLEIQARDMMNEMGFYPSGSLELDGRIHRFKTQPSDKKKKGWYVGYDKGDRVYLVFNDWRRIGPSIKICIQNGKTIQDFGSNDIDIQEHLRELEELETKFRKEEVIRQETASIESLQMWNQSSKTPKHLHPYLHHKNLESWHGTREFEDQLVVPLYDIDHKLWGLQKISPGGKKFFVKGMKKKGCFFTIGGVEESSIILIAEGFATAASVFESCWLPVVVAFDAHNLSSVSVELRKKYPKKVIIFTADCDVVGINAATVASKKIKGKTDVILPVFEDGQESLKDFNDFVNIHGKVLVGEWIRGHLVRHLKKGESWKTSKKKL